MGIISTGMQNTLVHSGRNALTDLMVDRHSLKANEEYAVTTPRDTSQYVWPQI